ncbi:MAG TPA: dienelactone hydrolase family protein [Xanthobacteraceae bacterium]
MTDVTIETPNGSIDAVLEIPSGEAPWPGVVVIHDAFGLREPHREIARRIADNGYLAVAPNLFARGGMIRCMQAVFNDLMAYKGRAFDYIAAARKLLSRRSDCTGAIGIAGFCMGGGFALVASTKGFGASAPFYPPPLQRKYATIVDGACPIVASFGKRDPLNRGSGKHLEEVLTEKKIPHDVKTYRIRGTASPTMLPCRRCLASSGSAKTRRPPPTHGRGCSPSSANTCSDRSTCRQGSH